MRTHATGQPHIVTDNHGLRLHLSLPKEVKQRIKEERAAKRDFNGWLISLFAAAVWILCIVWRR